MEKVTKINLKIICTSADPGENVQSFKKTDTKFMRSCNHQVPYVYTSEVRKWQSLQRRKKVTQIKARIISKAHAHLQTMEKNVQSLKKIGIKLYDELCSRGTHCLYTEVEKWQSSQWGKSKNKWSHNHIPTSCTSSYHEVNTCKVS